MNNQKCSFSNSLMPETTMPSADYTCVSGRLSVDYNWAADWQMINYNYAACCQPAAVN